jgi:ATP-binding cassette subfamily B (MDR/TAP) protein 1
MGQGTVIEQGTHDELLRDEDGAYTRLVRAQNLRDGNSGVCDDASGTTEQDRTLEPGLDDRRIGRKDTFNSETFGKALITRPPEEKAQHSFVPLFRRMGALNREALPDYLLGGFFAICEYVPFLL